MTATQDSRQDERLRDAVTAATAYYCAPPRRAVAEMYLHRRGMDTTRLRDCPLGYAPPGWTRVVDALRGSFTEATLIEAGLARRSSRGTLIDTFRGRVMFPISDEHGPVGFTGRDTTARNADTPKYLNTRRTPIFDKSALLYRPRHRDDGQPILVEGPTDALALAASADARELAPMAICGTALTEQHVRLIPGSRVVIAFDADPAGQQAVLSAGRLLRDHAVDVRVAQLPDGADPAGHLVDNHPGAFRFDEARPLIDVEIDRLLARNGERLSWVEGRISTLRQIAATVRSATPDEVARRIVPLSQRLRLDRSTVTEELVAAYARQTLTPGICR